MNFGGMASAEEEDVEEDQWEASRRRKQSKESATYGIFWDSEDEDSPRRSKKRGRNQPVSFVSSGTINPETGKVVKPAPAEEEEEEDVLRTHKGSDEETDKEDVPEPAPQPTGAAEAPVVKGKVTIVLPKKKAKEPDPGSAAAAGENQDAEELQPKRAKPEPELKADFAAFLDGTKTGSAVWKMMSNCGFRGRLGMNEQGMIEPIAVKSRPARAGLGVIEEKTTQQKQWERQQKIDKGELSDDDIFTRAQRASGSGVGA
eukprot:RCo050986